MPPVAAAPPSAEPLPGTGSGGKGAGDGKPKAKGGKGKMIAIIAALLVVVLVAVAGGGWFLWRRHAAGQAAGSSAQSSRQTQSTQEGNESSDAEASDEAGGNDGSDGASASEDGDSTEDKQSVTEVTLGSVRCGGDWKWHAGVISTGAVSCGGSDEYAVNVWVPGEDSIRTVDFSLLQDDDEKTFDDPELVATYGDDPAVFILYNVKTKAKGTTPESVHMYVQQVDLDKRTLGERIDLMTESDNVVNAKDDYEHQWVASSDSAVLIAKTWKTDAAGHVSLMMLRPGLTKAAAVRTIDNAEVDSHTYTKDATVYSSTHDGTYLVRDTAYHLYAVNDGRELTKFPLNFCRTDGDDGSCSVTAYYRLKEGAYAVTTDSYGSNVEDTNLIDASGKVTRLSSLAKGPRVVPAGMTQLSDGSLTFWSHIEDGGFWHGFRLFTLSTDFKLTEVLDADQWSRLFGSSSVDGYKGVNYLTKEFYVRTTDEQIVVNEKGESIGTYGTLPMDDDPFGDTDHTAVKWIAWESGSDGGGRTVLTTGKAPTGSAVSLESTGSSDDD